MLLLRGNPAMDFGFIVQVAPCAMFPEYQFQDSFVNRNVAGEGTGL